MYVILCETGRVNSTRTARPGPGRARKTLNAAVPSAIDIAAPVAVRPVRRGDLDQIVTLDARVTGLEKRSYWQSLYRRYGTSTLAERQFLVAEAAGRVVGFVIGEVRDWEFGSPPCGWVFAIDVHPEARLAGIGTNLLEAICAGFRRAGVRKVRTMLSRENNLILSFFRSQGMMAGPFIPLEMDLGR